MRNEASLVLAVFLVLGVAHGAAPVAKPAAAAAPEPAKSAATPAVTKPAVAPAAPKATKAATPPLDAKKVMDEKELQAEIASLQHLSPKTGEMEAPEHFEADEEEFEHEATAKPNKMAAEHKGSVDVEKLKKSVFASKPFQQKVQASCARSSKANCMAHTSEALFCQLLRRSKPQAAVSACSNVEAAPSLVQISSHLRHSGKAPEDELAKEMTHDLEMNFNKIAPFGKEDTAKELQDHAAKTQDTLVDAVENAEVAEIKRAVFRALTRLRAATIKEFDTIARLETQAIDAYNDAHHYRAENPLAHLHEDEAPVETDKLKSFH